MGKILVLAEKPSVGKELARVLGCHKQEKGYFYSENYIVTWALGHLVTLEEPESYGPQYNEWKMETRPMLPKKMNLKVIPETAKQFFVVKQLMQKAEVTSLIIATDAGREGELVARWIIDKVGFKKPIQRLWISSQTDKAIKEGFQHLKDGKEFDNLYQSAQARAEADWLVGLNVTRALTCKFQAHLSAGRVQTPTLAMIVEREERIKQFQPKEYFEIYAQMDGVQGIWRDQNNRAFLYDRQRAEEISRKVKGKKATVVQVNQMKKSTPAPLLYDLTELQRAANQLYQMSPKETLNVMQQLYERHKALTYPRTDSRYLTKDIVPTLRDRLKAVAKGEFAPIVSEILRENKKIAASCINDSKVTDHHAIIPTEETIDVLKLSSSERRIYFLVVRRFLQCFYPSFERMVTKYEFTCEGERFTSVGSVVMEEGWKKLQPSSIEDEIDIEKPIPQMKEQAQLCCNGIHVKKLYTSPPPRYTEATLLSAMEDPTRFIEDKKMRKYMGGGLGTPATRADIIEKLYQTFYIEKKGNTIYPTQKGIQIVRLVPKDLSQPLLTAEWEKKLGEIGKGNLSRQSFIKSIQSYTTELVQEVAESHQQYVHDNLTRTPCPACGKPMLAVQGKRGKMLVCQDRTCGYRQNVSIQTNARCPVCHKRLELIGSGEKKMFVCATCGFKERENVFREHLKQKHGASKNDVRKYMNQQKKEASGEESPLAKALLEALQLNKNS